jgi:HSP20 family protein
MLFSPLVIYKHSTYPAFLTIVNSTTKIYLSITNNSCFEGIKKNKDEKMAMIPSFFNNRSRDIIFDPFSSFDPFKDFPFPSSPLIPRENSALVNTRIDWTETPEAHVFKADLPGLKKEEVKVEIEDDRVLQISGERNVEKEDMNDTWHRVERSSGKFLRRFKLPENVKTDQVKAGMENGVLTVTVPKKEVKKPDAKKTIEISG